MKRIWPGSDISLEPSQPLEIETNVERFVDIAAIQGRRERINSLVNHVEIPNGTV
jgi:hypothetical protein